MAAKQRREEKRDLFVTSKIPRCTRNSKVVIRMNYWFYEKKNILNY